MWLSSETLRGDTAEQDSVNQKRSGLVFYPIIYYTPETKMAFGATVTYFFREAGSTITSRPSIIFPLAIYTQNKQFITQMDVDLYWKDELYHLDGSVGYQKYPGKFYGIGNSTSETNEEEYTYRQSSIDLSFQTRVWKRLYLGALCEIIHNTITEFEEGGMLARGEIPGSGGGTATGPGLLLNWDTRDHIFFPTTGSYHKLSSTFYGRALGGEFTFNKYTLDLRHYYSLHDRHVLAAQGLMNITIGNPPYSSMSLMGGDSLMRGYYLGRYRDNHMIALQVEYRSPQWRRAGVVAFAGLADVASELNELQIRDFKYSVGFGLRYMINPEENINLRLDFGFGKETFGVYMKILEAF